jgi:multicomponent K+:H+ antiporter subunit E
MKRIKAKFSPVLVIVLTLLWLMLNQTLAPGQILLGLVIAVVLSWSASALRPLQARMRRIDELARLVVIVFIDIIRSNIAVARVVLGLVTDRKVRSGFLQIPLDMRDPHGLAGLAMIVTSTPGTVWVGVSPEGDTLTLHVLDLKDEAEWIHLIKHRYERALMRIFE